MTTMTTPAQPPSWAVELVDSLDRQCQIYHELHALSLGQEQVVQEGNAGELMKLLAKRQRLIDQALELNSQIEPYKERWTNFGRLLDVDTRDTIQNLLDEIEDVLHEVMASDDRDRAVLQRSLDDTKKEMNKLNRGTQVNNAYASAGRRVRGPRYTDRNG